jgi:hypothetical protein
LYNESNIVTYIKLNRLRWAGHVTRLEEQSPASRVLVAVVEGRRQRGTPKLQWEDGVMEDARKLWERNWRNAARNREGQLAEASEEGLGSKWAVVPMMMMMMMMTPASHFGIQHHKNIQAHIRLRNYKLTKGGTSAD